MKIKKVAVLGSGVMGSQIAAHCRGCGVEVSLYGMPEDSHWQESAAYALERLTSIKPDPLVDKESLETIRRCDYQQHRAELKEVDLVIEAIVEDRASKLKLYQEIAPHLGEQTILATNTSGISVNGLALGLPKQLQSRFLGLHFFNPPRYMRLLEVIVTQQTSASVSHRLTYFLTTVLGKYLIYAQDSPAFIANRVGMFAMLSSIYQAERYELAPDTVDALSGQLIDRSKSATFRTMDLVGLDICQKVVLGVRNHAIDDPWQKFLRLPEWMEALCDRGALGVKSGKGVYQKIDGQIQVIDPATSHYRPIDKRIDDRLHKRLKKCQSFSDILLNLSDMHQPQALFLWATFCDLFQYAAFHAEGIAPCLRDIDLAWRLGFGARAGIFENAQRAGWATVVEAVNVAIDNDVTLIREPLPAWCATIESVYRPSGAYAPRSRDYSARSTHPVYERQLDPLTLFGESSPFEKFERVHETDHLRCVDIGDGIASLAFKTKMRVIGFELIDDMNKLLDQLPASHQALVIWQGDGVFCFGANLYQILAGVKFGTVQQSANWLTELRQRAFEWLQPDLPEVHHLPPISEAIVALQNLHLRLRYGDLPVIAAVQNMALGAGCELLMHCDRVVAHNEAYIGLVEAGVGLLPAGGGCTELARRVAERAADRPLFPYLVEVFKDVARAYVSTSAREARAHGFLSDHDVIMANPDELLHISKQLALQILEENYVPPRLRDIRVAGELGKANLLTELNNLLVGHWITEHDHRCASALAHCLSGGDLPENTMVSPDWLLKLEQDGFQQLLSTEPTQQRIEHTLKTGRPLRN